MSLPLVICVRCEHLQRRPLADSRVAEAVCGLSGQPVSVMAERGCPVNRFAAGQTAAAPAPMHSVRPATGLELEARRAACEACDERSAWGASPNEVWCDAARERCPAGRGRVLLTVGRCWLGRWPRRPSASAEGG